MCIRDRAPLDLVPSSVILSAEVRTPESSGARPYVLHSPHRHQRKEQTCQPTSRPSTGPSYSSASSATATCGPPGLASPTGQTLAPTLVITSAPSALSVSASNAVEVSARRIQENTQPLQSLPLQVTRASSRAPSLPTSDRTSGNGLEAVSYTHLTLPTKRIV